MWFQYSAALNATAVSHALHTKLGRKPASIQLAAALSLPSSAAVARLLAEGKVSLVKFAVSETSRATSPNSWSSFSHEVYRAIEA